MSLPIRSSPARAGQTSSPASPRGLQRVVAPPVAAGVRATQRSRDQAVMGWPVRIGVTLHGTGPTAATKSSNAGAIRADEVDAHIAVERAQEIAIDGRDDVFGGGLVLEHQFAQVAVALREDRAGRQRASLRGCQ